jgi:egghead protein (zeste-white 4 protein)
VPSDYQTSTGALNKARALQYCWEDTVNLIQDDEWVVHLDEETLLSPESVKGILNFISNGKHSVGQGMITYAHEQV